MPRSYSAERFDADDQDTKEEELDKIERHFKINMNVDTNGIQEEILVDRRSICKYDDALNLMRYNHHFMYIQDLNQMRHCYRCKKCSKISKNMEACNRHEKKCDELIKHTFPGETYNKSKSIFDKIDKQLIILMMNKNKKKKRNVNAKTANSRTKGNKRQSEENKAAKAILNR